MKKRINTKTVFILIAALLAIGWFCLYILAPRIMLRTFTKQFDYFIDVKAEYFTDFSIKGKGDLMKVDNGYISLELPSKYSRDESKNSFVFKTDNKHFVYVTDPSDNSDLNLLNADIHTVLADSPDNIGINEITEGFEKLGCGLPDSAYNTHKCMYLVDSSNSCFWDYNKSLAYSILAAGKFYITAAVSTDEIYLYERDKVCGIIYVIRHEDSVEIQSSFYSTDDLNTEHMILMNAEDADEAFGIINSLEFIK